MNYLFIGNQPELKNEAIADKKKSLLDPASENLNFSIFRTGEDDFNLLKDALYTLPFLSKARLVVVKDFHKANSEEIAAVLSYLEKPSKTACLILEAAGGFEKESAFADITGLVKVRRFDSFSDHDLDSWINKELSAVGKKMDRTAKDLLKELIGDDLAVFKKELEKLAIFTEGRPGISGRDVEILTTRSRKLLIFDLSNAILKKDISGGLRIMQDLFLDGKKPPEILGMLAWQLRTLLSAKEFIKEKPHPSGMARQINVSNAISKKAIRERRCFSAYSIVKNIEAILKTDVAIKKGQVNSPELALEVLLVELCKQ